MGDHNYAVRRSLSREPLWQKTKPLLSHLDIELTERCNNACIHCYINLPAADAQAQARELTTGEWKDILRQAADLGVLSVRITGGEPLLRPDFAEIYLFARRLGMRVMIFTNARLITRDLADLFSRVPPLQKIEITVYGMHPESYDTVACMPGAYAEFWRGIALLQEKQIPFVIKAALLPPNKREMTELEAWAATIPWMERPPSYAMFLDLRGRRDSEAKNRLITRLRASPDEAANMARRGAQTYHSGMAEFAAKFMGPPGDRLFSCQAGESGCVDAYGKYQMCMLLRHPDFVYDLKKGTLREALTTVFPNWRELRASNPDYLARCARCFLKGLCEQCPAKSWTEHGTLDSPVEYLCQVAHAEARYAGLLADGEHAWEVADWQERIRALSADDRAAQ